jgi:hypothetical protein
MPQCCVRGEKKDYEVKRMGSPNWTEGGSVFVPADPVLIYGNILVIHEDELVGKSEMELDESVLT